MGIRLLIQTAFLLVVVLGITIGTIVAGETGYLRGAKGTPQHWSLLGSQKLQSHISDEPSWYSNSNEFSWAYDSSGSEYKGVFAAPYTLLDNSRFSVQLENSRPSRSPATEQKQEIDVIRVRVPE